MFVPSERAVLIIMRPHVMLGAFRITSRFISRDSCETISTLPFYRQENLAAEKPFAKAGKGLSCALLQRLWLSLPSPVSIGITSRILSALGLPSGHCQPEDSIQHTMGKGSRMGHLRTGGSRTQLWPLAFKRNCQPGQL